MSLSEKGPKDWWDKFEIIGKVVVGVTVPIVVASSAYFLNNQISERARSADLIRIAIGILQEDPTDEIDDDPLRSWAIAVLQNPTGDNTLTDEAAEQLRGQAIISYEAWTDAIIGSIIFDNRSWPDPSSMDIAPESCASIFGFGPEVYSERCQELYPGLFGESAFDAEEAQ